MVRYECSRGFCPRGKKETTKHHEADQPGLHDDDGYELNSDLVTKPSLCLSCVRDDDPREEILCTLNRLDQEGEAEFLCAAYAPKRRT